MTLSRTEVRHSQILTTRAIICIVLAYIVFIGWVGMSLWAYFNLPAAGAYVYGQTAAQQAVFGDHGMTDNLREAVMNYFAEKGEGIYSRRWIIGSVLGLGSAGIIYMMLTLKPAPEDS